jgi:hypothetical protein
MLRDADARSRFSSELAQRGPCASSGSALSPARVSSLDRASTACWAGDDDKLYAQSEGSACFRSQRSIVSMDAPQPLVKSFVLSRWRGQMPLATVFWRGMIIVGTTINVLTSVTSIGLFALDLGAATALAVHFLPLPLNILLFVSVWRSVDSTGRFEALGARIAAAVWFVGATIL